MQLSKGLAVGLVTLVLSGCSHSPESKETKPKKSSIQTQKNIALEFLTDTDQLEYLNLGKTETLIKYYDTILSQPYSETFTENEKNDIKLRKALALAEDANPVEAHKTYLKVYREIDKLYPGQSNPIKYLLNYTIISNLPEPDEEGFGDGDKEVLADHTGDYTTRDGNDKYTLEIREYTEAIEIWFATPERFARELKEGPLNLKDPFYSELAKTLKKRGEDRLKKMFDQ